MGLDMYLYSTGHNHRRVHELAVARAKEFDAFRESLYASEKYAGLADLPRLDGNYVDSDKLTKEQRSLIATYLAELGKKAHALGGFMRRNCTYAYIIPEGEEDPVHEIGYWRKEWPLHEFIIKNFGDPNNDNLTEVYLDEAAITKIIDHYKDRIEYSDPFRQALYIVRGGGVVYYWAWY